MSLQVEKLEKNMAKLTMKYLLKNWRRQSKVLTRRIRTRSAFPVSVRARLPVR